MKVLVINGANLNMLGIREPAIYGNNTYKDLVKYIKSNAKELDIKATVKQSNIEGEIVTYIQKAYQKYDYIILNAGGYTHTSVVIKDAIKAVKIKTIEVHLTNINEREEFRKVDLIKDECVATFMGKGFESYKDALKYCKEN